jgi:hypothetical protein
MHTKRIKAGLAAVAVGVVAAGIAVLPATAAFAHAERDVGPYTVAIGFGTEPAFVGFPNSLEVIVHRTADGKGIEDAADTLQAEVVFGTQTMPVALEPNFDADSGGSSGDYRGAFIPTAPGDYTFHVFGTIEGTKIEERITSAPDTFDSVTDPSTIEFPAKYPTVAELSTKLDRDTARIQAAADASAKSAKDAADSAKTLGMVGVAVGSVGILIGIVALVRRRA